QPSVLPGVLDEDGDLGLGGARCRSVPADECHDLVGVEGGQALVVGVVDGGQVLEDARRRSREHREEAPIHAFRRQATEEATHPFEVAGLDGTDCQRREWIPSVHNLNLVSSTSERKRIKVTPCGGARSISRTARSPRPFLWWAIAGPCSS